MANGSAEETEADAGLDGEHGRMRGVGETQSPVGLLGTPSRSFTTKEPSVSHKGASGMAGSRCSWAVVSTQHPQSLAPLASGPLQSSWMVSVTCLSAARKGGEWGVGQDPTFPLTGQKDWGQVCVSSRPWPWAHLSWAGCPQPRLCPLCPPGLQPLSWHSRLGFPQGGARWCLPWKSWRGPSLLHQICLRDGQALSAVRS